MKRTQKAQPPSDLNRSGKKPYLKPRCISEPIYETLALACSKMPGQSAVCGAAPKRS